MVKKQSWLGEVHYGGKGGGGENVVNVVAVVVIVVDDDDDDDDNIYFWYTEKSLYQMNKQESKKITMHRKTWMIKRDSRLSW